MSLLLFKFQTRVRYEFFIKSKSFSVINTQLVDLYLMIKREEVGQLHIKKPTTTANSDIQIQKATQFLSDKKKF